MSAAPAPSGGPSCGASDNEGVVVLRRRSNEGGGDPSSTSGPVSRASGDTGASTAPTTTISTIAVQSGGTRIVLALLQSGDWLELRVVELSPGLVYLGSTLEEADALQRAHHEVLTKLQSKQSPVEDLLNQADQLISTQRPRAEVYAAMAESLGLAWRDLNAHLETRKNLLDLSVTFHTRARQYSDALDAAEKVYTDNVMPSDVEGARQLLSSLHDHKRAILESSMYTLQEAHVLLGRLKALLQEGGTMDSRPRHIRTNIEFACSQIEHYLESLHDRRRFMDGLFVARKHHLDQCLALCILYQDLTEAILNLKKLRDEISEHQDLGTSQGNAEILLHEHLRRETAAKAQQDQCVRHVRTAEQMVATGHYAGAEARARTYSVLEAATALHETCDTRTALLQQSALFYRLANGALTKLDQAEVQVAALSTQGGGNQRLSMVMGVVEEAVQPALTEGYALLEVTGGRGQPHNQGVTEMVEQLENRRTGLSSTCADSTEKVLQRTELVNSFLEMYNSIESWLVKIGDSFLRGHQDPGGSLSLSKDFLHLHLTLKNDLADKKQEIDTLGAFLEQLSKELPEDEFTEYKQKVENIRKHWTSLEDILDSRIALSEKYVKFHEDAEEVNVEFENLEGLLKAASTEKDDQAIDEKWKKIQNLYRELETSGKDFIKVTREGEYPYLDVNRAVLVIQFILENLGKRKLVVTDLFTHHQMKISVNKELTNLWITYRETLKKMEFEMQNLEDGLCPLLKGDSSQPENLANSLEKRLGNYVKEIKNIQEDIENMVTKAEGLAHSDMMGAERPTIVRALLQLYQNIQNKATDYQILGTMLIQWCRNIAEVHRSCDKLEKQFGGISVDSGGVERQLKELDASKHAVHELLKFAQHEADAIIQKIRVQCPREPGAKDIAMMQEMLERRRKIMEENWTERQTTLENQLKKSQYQTDLKVIRDQLRDLSDQLSKMKGHYGDSLNAALNMKTAFNHFNLTVGMLGRRIENFVSTAEKMLVGDDDAKEIQFELSDLQNKWSTFHMQVGDSQKSIELSIEFFKLVQEAESWFKNGSQLLVNVAGESSQIQNPEQARKLQQKIESFLTPGEIDQANRITKITHLAVQLYGDTTPQQVDAVSHQNRYMLESFNVINQNLAKLMKNLKDAEEQKQNQEKEQQELAASLAQAQAEADTLRLAALAAEEARRVAEETVTQMAMHRISSSETVEVIVQTDDIPPPKQEGMIVEQITEVKKEKIIEEEPHYIPPMFLTPLVGATVSEGVKFTFECRVTGLPVPEVEWLKDGLSIMTNPDYKTSFDNKVCTLTIEETFTEDSALFTCKAVNIAGTAESSANLIVKEAVPAEILSPPLFTKRLQDCSAQEGSSFQLEAMVTGHPLPVVSWTKNGFCIDSSPDYIINYNNGECILRFEELFLEDGAEYACKASNDLGEDVTKSNVTVLATVASEKPSFPIPLSNLMARAGQKFKLECEVKGTPMPSLAWFHNGKPVKETPDCKISFDGKMATLIISEAFPKNAGKYTLVAKNTAGETQTSSNVSVKGRIPTETSDSEITSDIDVEPVKPSIQQPLKDAYAKEGDTIRLDCIIIGQPEPEVIWYHDEKPVKESEDIRLLFHGDRCSLVIQEALVEDVGMYKVVAMNSAGEASTACYVNVQVAPPKIPSPIPQEEVFVAPPAPPAIPPQFSILLINSHMVEGESASLKTCVSGSPKPTIAWYRDGIPLLPDDQLQIYEETDGYAKIYIPHTNLDHTGQYEVVASNSAGTAKSCGFLSIEQRLPTPLPAEPQEPPGFLKLLEDITVESGESVSFRADVTGKPKPSVYWTLNDSPINEFDYLHGVKQYLVEEKEPGKHSLRIAYVSKGIGGRLSIVAENDVGRAVSACHLNVFDPPSPVPPPSAPSAESFERRTIVSETHVTKFVTSSSTTDGGDAPSSHSFASSSTSQLSSVSGQPTVQVHGSRIQQFDQDGFAAPELSEKVSLIKIEGDKVVEQVNTESSSTPAFPPAPKKILASKRKATPARFITPLQGIILKEGERAAFESLIDGFPDPTVTWTQNGNSLPEDAAASSEGNRVFLVIPAVGQQHGGRYTCSLDNEAGSAQCTCDLVVRKIQFPPVFSKRLQPSVIGVGERLHLEIDVSGTPIPDVGWSKNGAPLQSNESLSIKTEGTRSWLVIPEAKESDSGRYGVIASNSAGRAECLADVMVTNLSISEPSKTFVFTDVSDDTRSQSAFVEKGHVQNLKRVIESSSTDIQSPVIPISLSKVVTNPPEQLTPSSHFLPSTETEIKSESIVTEEKVERKLPGKLRLSWPPLPSDDEGDLPQKPDIDISKDKVSNIISSFSVLAETEAPVPENGNLVLVEKVDSKIWEPSLIPAPQPQYGFIEAQQPEEIEQSTNYTPDFNLEHNIQYSSELETFDGDLSDILSTPATSDYYPKTSPSIEIESTEKFQAINEGPIISQAIAELTEPEDMEVRTEKHSRESSFTEIKKSMSTSEKTIIETKVYRDYPEGEVIETVEITPTTTKTEEVIEHVIPEPEKVVEFVSPQASKTADTIHIEFHETPTQTFKKSDKPYVSESFSSTEKSSNFSTQESHSSYVSSTEVETKIYPDTNVDISGEAFPPPVVHQVTPYSVTPEFMDRDKMIQDDLTSGDEHTRSHLQTDNMQQDRKTKKKRESVKEIALRLEESIMPVTPDEVPGGIRMFPPKPSTPSVEAPQSVPLHKEHFNVSESETEENIKVTFKEFPKLEPFPFKVEERPTIEKSKLPPPPKPKKFVPGSFTDSECESDFDTPLGEKFVPRKIHFEAKTISQAKVKSSENEPAPPSDFDKPPIIEGMRPDVLKKEYSKPEEKIKKTVNEIPRKNPKIVQKFLAKAGEQAELEITKPKAPKGILSPQIESNETLKESKTLDREVHMKETVTTGPTPKKLEKEWPPPREDILPSAIKEIEQLKTTADEPQIQVESFQTAVKQQSYSKKETKRIEMIHEQSKSETLFQSQTENVEVPALKRETEYEIIENKQPHPPPKPQPPIETPRMNPESFAPVVSSSFMHSATAQTNASLQGFKSVKAPAVSLKKDTVVSSPTPAPSFDHTIVPTFPAQIQLKESATKDFEADKSYITSRESTKQIFSKNIVASQKQTKGWPPKTEENNQTITSWGAPRSHSLERPTMNVVPTLPTMPHEAPSSIYWSSNITLKEKRKSLPIDLVDSSMTSNIVSGQIESQKQSLISSQHQSKFLMQKEHSKKESKHVKIDESAIFPQKKIKSTPVVQRKPTPPPSKVPPILSASISKMETLEKSQSDALSHGFKPIPQLEPFPYEVSASKDRVRQYVPPPPMPKKFVPGSFTESDYESDYEGKPPAIWRPYMSDTESTEYKPLKVKLKQGRHRRQNDPSPPAPVDFDIPPQITGPLRPTVSLSDLEHDIPQMKKPLPMTTIKCKFTKKNSAKTKTPAIIKPVPLKPVPVTPVMSSPVSKKPVSVSPSLFVPVPVKSTPIKPDPVSQTLKYNPLTPITANKQTPVISPHVQLPLSLKQESEQTNIEQKKVSTSNVVSGVRSLRDKFQADSSFSDIKPKSNVSSSKAETRIASISSSPSPARGSTSQKHVSFTKKEFSASSESNISQIPFTIPSENVIIPFVHETFPVKPPSFQPLIKREAENISHIPRELEESGYTADTEATLPRKTTKSQTYQETTNMSTFSKSESHSTSFSSSKSEDKNVQSSQSSTGNAFRDFPSGSIGSFGGINSDSGGGGGGFPFNGGPANSFSFPSQPFPTFNQSTNATSSFSSSESKSSQYYSSSKTEETFEKQPGASEGKKREDKSQNGKRKPKFEEYRRETKGTPSSHGPFSEDTYYSMSDESEVLTNKGKKKSNVEMKTESHVQVMSDKKSEYYSYSSGDQSEKPKRESPKAKKKKVTKISDDIQSKVYTAPKQERKIEIVVQDSEPKIKEKPQTSTLKSESMRSIGLVKQEMTRHEEGKELDLKHLLLESEPNRTIIQRGPPPPKPKVFVKGEVSESEYVLPESKILPLWKVPDSDTDDPSYGKVNVQKSERKLYHHERSPTPPSKYDPYPKFDDTPRPVIEFPDSEPEIKEFIPKVSPKIIKKKPDTPKIVQKQEKGFKTQPPNKTPKVERPTSPRIEMEPPPEVGYIKPTQKQTPFSNAVGVESTKITKIEDSSQYHKRFVSMQQTTRVIKLTDSPKLGPFKKSKVFKETYTHDIKPIPTPKVVTESQVHQKPQSECVFEIKPMPYLEPFPFKPEPTKPKKERGPPPPKPKKFIKGEMRESDYDSDSDISIKPKWQPPDSDLDEPTYGKVETPKSTGKRVKKPRERSPTPPMIFETPPPTGEPMRPKVDVVEFIVQKDPSPELVMPLKVSHTDEKKLAIELITREQSPPLPPPGSPPQEGIITRKVDYVVDGVNVETKSTPPSTKAVPTFKKKPFREVIEKTERKITNQQITEERTFKTGKIETIKTIVTELKPEEQPFDKRSEIKSNIEEVSNQFPFKVGKTKLCKDKGPTPSQPTKFSKIELKQSSYDSEHEEKIPALWKPYDSDLDEPSYSKLEVSLPNGKRSFKNEERGPTPPSKFDKGPPESHILKKVVDTSVVELQTKQIQISKDEKQKFMPKPVIDTEKIKSQVIIKPLIPEPGPKPEIGFIKPETVQQIQKDFRKTKRGIDIDIDIVDIYDYASESESEKVDSDIGGYKSYPDLEPFPYTPDPPRTKRERGQPPPMPKKFMKGEFKESDYGSDHEGKIPPKWGPTDSEGEGLAYRKVKAPSSPMRKIKNEGNRRVPSPPSKFDQPPSFEGPPRPTVDMQDIPRRERRESLEEYSIPKFPKVEFKPFDLDDSDFNRPDVTHTTDTETDTEGIKESSLKTSVNKRYAESTQKYVGEQFSDMNQTFRTKAQKFAEQLVSEVFADRDGSGLLDRTKEPSVLTKDLKDSPREDAKANDGNELDQPHVYRDESRVSEFGSKHIDPDSGLIYFKYDFGYEFGILLPGEGKKVERSRSVPPGDQNGDIEIPVIHIRSDDESTYPKKSKAGVSKGDKAYDQYRGKVIPHFVPQKQAQFKPIFGDPISDSEVESRQTKDSSKLIGKRKENEPKGFLPHIPGVLIKSSPQHLPGPKRGPVYQLSSPSLVSSASAAATAMMPTFITSLKDVSAPEGKELRLECVVKSNIPPRIGWFKDGRPLAADQRFRTQFQNGVCRLIVPLTQHGDSGHYTCTAENAIGTDTTSSSVEISPGEKS